MSGRPAVPMRTQRMLWADSMRRCSNPNCEVCLFSNDTFTGELAHIVAREDGGDVSYENLIVLCRGCHKIVDDQRTEDTVPMLLQWKENRSAQIRQQFAKAFSSFEELKANVVPILESNQTIFANYGPNNDGVDCPERHAMWLRFEPRLITNNHKLVLLLDANRKLFHAENWAHVEAFRLHVEEFKETRGDESNLRVKLFPSKLNSMFGIEPVNESLIPNVAAFQNYISSLVDDGRFVSLDLVDEQVLTYLEEGREVQLSLNDRPNVHQIFWNGGFYKNQRTQVRLKELVFVLQWLANRNYDFEFQSQAKLTQITVNNRWPVFFCYEYCVSVTTLYNAPDVEDLVIVNLHGWNGGPFSLQAAEYAKKIGATIMNQEEFFLFLRENPR